jgi:hypothetical protein
MAHNWATKTIADYPTPTNRFTAVTGDDTLGTGTADNPYRSIPRGGLALASSTKTLVIGTGGYTGAISTSEVSFVGEEGKMLQTVINLNGSTMSCQNLWVLKDLTVKNGLLYSVSQFGNFTRCRFIDMNFQFVQVGAGAIWAFTDCEFINCNIGQVTFNRTYFTRCKMFNTAVLNLAPALVNSGCEKLESCYVDSFSRVEFKQSASIVEIANNDIQGTLRFQDGANPNTNLTLAQALIDYPAKVQTNNINLPPQFADVSKMAFTVSNASPLIGAGKTQSNIGNVKRGDAYFCGINPEMTDTGIGGTATFTDFIGTTDKTVDPAASTGEFVTGAITVNSETVSVLGVIEYIGKYALDSSLGGAANSQVPDNYDYAEGTGGDSPDNLTFEMRWSTGAVPPVLDADYDNGGIIPAGDFATFIWNLQPRMDGAYIGNGDPAYNSASSYTVGVKWIQIKGRVIKSTWNNI